MKKLIILLTIAALVCVTFTAMAAGDGIAFDRTEAAINEGETLQTALTREGAAEGGELTYMSSDQKVAARPCDRREKRPRRHYGDRQGR